MLVNVQMPQWNRIVSTCIPSRFLRGVVTRMCPDRPVVRLKGLRLKTEAVAAVRSLEDSESWRECLRLTPSDLFLRVADSEWIDGVEALQGMRIRHSVYAYLVMSAPHFPVPRARLAPLSPTLVSPLFLTVARALTVVR